jgi:hypothetical protein
MQKHNNMFVTNDIAIKGFLKSLHIFIYDIILLNATLLGAST